MRFLEGEEKVLASADVGWQLDEVHDLAIEIDAGRIAARVDGKHEMTAEDDALRCGAVALVCEGGRAQFGPVNVKPLKH